MYTEFGTEHKLVILPRSRVRGVKLEEGAKSDMEVHCRSCHRSSVWNPFE